ncbi:MAG: SRPBCC domain-containing protein [Polyangiaceae bacterium]
MTATTSSAEKTESTFRLTYAVATDIRADAAKIWALLTDAERMSAWNSTVVSVKGPIELGQKLELRVKLAPERVFKPTVTKLEPASSMEWSDGMAPMFRGVRSFTLTPRPDGRTEFAMREEFSGLMLPLIKGSLPDFTAAFATYAADLKRAAEST